MTLHPPRFTVFDPNHPVHGNFCAGLIENLTDAGEYKLVLTDEDWAPNWTLPGDDRPRVLVTRRPAKVVGRGPNPNVGWHLEVLGADDTNMCLALDGPGRAEHATAVYNAIVDGTTKELLAQLGFEFF